MKYFKDDKGEIISMEDKFWPSVLKNEAHRFASGIYSEVNVLGRAIGQTQNVNPYTPPPLVNPYTPPPEPVKPVEEKAVIIPGKTFNNLEPLKIEKLQKPKSNAKNTRANSKRAAKKA